MKSVELLLNATILFCYIIFWVLGSEMNQLITTDDSATLYEKPAFITFINHSLLILFAPLLMHLSKKHTNSPTFSSYLKKWSGRLTLSQLFVIYGVIAIGYNLCIYAWIKGLEYVKRASCDFENEDRSDE